MTNYLDGYGKEFCTHCKKYRHKEGFDGCIGKLKNVMNACCGHGENNMAYVQFNHGTFDKHPNKKRLSGQEALDYITKNKN
jgi:hypothetical protein